MPTYTLLINDQPVDLAQARASLGELAFSWRGGAELTFTQAKPHHQADYLEEDDVELRVDGQAVFRGRLVERELRGDPGSESVGYLARGLRDRARDVAVVDPVTGVPEVTFNAPPEDEANWQAGRCEQTVGEIVQWLIDTFADELIAAGVLAQGGTHYLQAEVDALDVIPPEVVFHEVSVEEALLEVLRHQPDFGLRIDPATRRFRFLRFSTLPERTVTIDQLPEGAGDRVLANLLRPTTVGCYTAYEIRGERQLTPAVLYLSDGDLQEHWDPALEDSWTLARAFREYQRTDTGTGGVIQADTLTDTSKSWSTDEWVGGFLCQYVEMASGTRLIKAHRVLSNTATQVVIEGILLQIPEGGSHSYRLFNGVSPYRYVWSRYRITDPAKRLIVRQVPLVFQVANDFMLQSPLVERKLTVDGEESWVPVHTQVFTDGSGCVLTATPLYTVGPGESPTVPGQATGPEDVRLRCAYASGALTARYPESGYTGTAYSDAGLARTRVRYVPEFVLANDRAQYRELAEELLQPLKDVNYRGEIPLAGLDWDFTGLGHRINVAARDRADDPIVTGFESIAAPLAEVRYDFFRSRTTLVVATNVAETVYGPGSREESLYWQLLGRVNALRTRAVQQIRRVQMIIGPPTQNDGGARVGGDRGEEPPVQTTTTTTGAPVTTTSSIGPPPVTTTSAGSPATTSGTSDPPGTSGPPPVTTTSVGSPATTSGTSGPPPPVTTTSGPGSSVQTTTTSGGTEISHPCCPGGAPYRFGFSCAGFDEQFDGCTIFNGWSGEMTWEAGNSRWFYADAERTIALECEIYDDPGHPCDGRAVWKLTVSVLGCTCYWSSFADDCGAGMPTCGVGCDGGTFTDACWDQGADPIDCGEVTIWPI